MNSKLCLAGLLLAMAVGCNNGPAAQVSSVTLSGAALGQKGRLRVNLVNPASGSQKVDLSWGGAALNNPPTSITVPSGALSAELAYTAGSKLGGVSVTAKLGDTTAQSSGSVVASFQVVGLAQEGDQYYDEDYLELSVGGTETAAITLNAAPPADTQVDLTAAPAGQVNLPSSVTVPAFATSTTFTVGGTAQGVPTVTAKVGTASYQNVIQVSQTSDRFYANSSAYAGTTTYLEVYLGTPSDADVVAQITSSNTAVVNPPATLTVPAGSTYAEVYTPALASGFTVIKATIRGTTFSRVLRVSSGGFFEYSSSFPSNTMEVGVVGSVYAETYNGTTSHDYTINVTPSSVGVFDLVATQPWPAHTSEADVIVTAKNPGTSYINLGIDGEGGANLGPFTVVDHAFPTSLYPQSTPVKGVGNIFQVQLNASVAHDTTVTFSQTGTGHYTWTGDMVIPAGDTSWYLNMTPDTSGPVTVTAMLNSTAVTYTFTIP